MYLETEVLEGRKMVEAKVIDEKGSKEVLISLELM